MCLYPQLIKNPKYKDTIKNGGIIPPVPDPRVLYVPIGCQQCKECRNKKARQWQTRLQEDIKTNTNGKFIALTFSNEWYKQLVENTNGIRALHDLPHLKGYDLDNALAKSATRLFLERYRKKYKKSLRHWLITELGHAGTQNIHLHGIIWPTQSTLDDIEKIWAYGFMWKGKLIKNKLVNYVNQKTINYIIKYVTKVDEHHKYYRSIILTSPGIGKSYLQSYNSTKNTFQHTDTNETYTTPTGHKTSLPIYWRNQLYTDEEKEKLWLQKLDKQERWINGVRLDISTKAGKQRYWQYLKTKQQESEKLGYGNGKISWEQMEYGQQLQRRYMGQSKRRKKLPGQQRNNSTSSMQKLGKP